MTVSSATIEIRPMQPSEEKTVRSIAWKAFPLFEQLFISFSGKTLVAEFEERLVGSIVLNTFVLPGGRKGGVINWLFTDPAARGLGAGQRLVEGALDWFNSENCDEIVTIVEGYNASSFKQFATRGFSILTPEGQVQRYGWQLPIIWMHATGGSFMNVGHFLWVYPVKETADSQVLQLTLTILFHCLVGWLAVWRSEGFSGFDTTAFIAVPACLLLLLGTRFAAMACIAHCCGLRVRYRAWEFTLPITLIVAIAGGVLFAAPGGLYPCHSNWRYNDMLPTFGRMALAGTMVVLLITFGSLMLRELGDFSDDLKDWLTYVFIIGVPLVAVDTVVFFNPFKSYNGRRIWDWFLSSLGYS